MISQSIRNAALAALSGAAALAFLNAAIKPSKTQTIANSMRRDLDQYNATVYSEQDPRLVISMLLHPKSLVEVVAEI